VRKRPIFPTLLYVGGLVLLYAFLPFGGERWWLSGLLGVAAVIAVIPFIIRRLGRLQVSEQPIFDAIQALAVSVTALVLGFAALCESLAYHSNHFSGLDDKFDAAYFAVTTLSTVGYGDIYAVSNTARLIVTFQIIFNLVFLGGVVRIITNVGRERHRTLHGDTVLTAVVDRGEPLAEAVADDKPEGSDDPDVTGT
jgi:voltage-gated potassium channel